MSRDDEMDVYRERLGDALHRVAHPHHPWSGCAYPDLFYDKLTHFMGDLAASGLTVRPALLADTPSVEPLDEEAVLALAEEKGWYVSNQGGVVYVPIDELAALRPSVEPAGLDVERLARAIDLADAHTWDLGGASKWAEAIAAEYALLPTQASDSPEKTT